MMEWVFSAAVILLLWVVTMLLNRILGVLHAICDAQEKRAIEAAHEHEAVVRALNMILSLLERR